MTGEKAASTDSYNAAVGYVLRNARNSRGFVVLPNVLITFSSG